MKKNAFLKITLLCCCLITAMQNAIAGNIPEIAKSFTATSLSTIELMTTIPSLFGMFALFTNQAISHQIGNKKALLLGLLLCGIGGVVPFFIQEIYTMLISRAVYGFGTGLINANLLIMIVALFNGSERSQVIGLQGSVGGASSFLSTYVAGTLLIYGWHTSFIVYSIAFVVFVFVSMNVPDVQVSSKKEEQNVVINKKDILFYSIFSFLAVNLATFFVIKCASLITINHYGSVRDGSTLVMLVSIGSLLAGLVYARIYGLFKKHSLILFFIISALSYFLVGIYNNMLVAGVSAFLIGFGYLAFVPFLQEKVSIYGSLGTTTLLIFQSLGSFVTPYYGLLLNQLTPSLNMQFIFSGCFFIVLTMIYYFTKCKKAG